MVAWRDGIFLLVFNAIISRAQLTGKISSWTLKNKFHIDGALMNYSLVICKFWMKFYGKYCERETLCQILP